MKRIESRPSPPAIRNLGVVDRRLPLLCLLAVLLGLAACAEKPAPATQVVDLANALASAEVLSEPAEIDLGTGESEPLLIEGFSWNESSPDGTTFAWSDRPASALRLFLAEPRPLQVSLRLLPLPREGEPPQQITAWLNGEPVGTEIELPEGWSEVTFPLPLEAQRPGNNRFELRYRWTRSPDARHLAVAWDWLRLSPLGAAQPPPAAGPRAEGKRLTVPAGSHLSYFLDLPAGARLTFERLAVRGGVRTAGQASDFEGEPSLEITVELPGTPPSVAARLPSSPSGGSVDFGIEVPTLARIRLRTLSGSMTVLEGGAIEASSSATPASQSTASSGPPTAARVDSTSNRPNLLIYLVDTLRADRLGCYGHARPTSPHLDAFAKEAVLYERAFAQSSWTKASVASIFAGIWPRAHGIHSPEDAFAANLATLPELLQEAGYRTGAVATNAYISPEAGFARGFDHFLYLPNRPNRSNNVYRKAVELLDAYVASNDPSPFFLYLHTIDPHAPFAPPERERQLFAPTAPRGLGSVQSIRSLTKGGRNPEPEEVQALFDLYDGEIAFNDRQFGRLLTALRERGLHDNTLIVFVSDHGEAFREHGVFGHGWDLHSEVLRVPLVIKPAAGMLARLATNGHQPGSSVPETAQHLDLLPTLLAAAGLETPPNLPGRDLFAPSPEPAHRLAQKQTAFSFMRYSGRTGASVVLGDWHLTEPMTHSFGKHPKLFNLTRDPLEATNVLADHPVLAGYLRASLRAQLKAPAATAAQAEVDEETRAGLKALGYID